MKKYPAKIVKEEGHYIITFIDFANIMTSGNTLEDALHNAKEALNGCIESDFLRDFSLPSPSDIIGEDIHWIELEPHIELAIILREIRADKSPIEIAKKLGISYKTYQNLEDHSKCNPTLKTLEKIVKNLGKKLEVNII